MITVQQIADQQQRVRVAYSDQGFHSAAYQQGFDKLQYMAQQYRNERGLPPNARTPYN